MGRARQLSRNGIPGQDSRVIGELRPANLEWPGLQQTSATHPSPDRRGCTPSLTRKSFTASGTTFPYGVFVQAMLSFIIIAAVVYFFVVKPVTRLMEKFKTEPEIASPTKECTECLSSIPAAAARCAFCTVEQLA